MSKTQYRSVCRSRQNEPQQGTHRLIPVLLALGSLASAAVSPAQLPQVLLDTHYVTPTGVSIVVNSGGDLQTAINNAQPGDEIVLQAGARFIGNYLLHPKNGTKWITIRSSQLSSLPEGSRVAGQATHMATVSSANAMPVFTAEPGANFYRLSGLEITVEAGVTLNYGLVALGGGTETTLAQLPSDFIVDRSYLHGVNGCNCKRGVQINGKRQAVVDSYISEIHADGQDAQAICGWNGPGPFKIVNNYLEGGAENVLFGGAVPSIANIIPSDIEFRHNHVYKQLSWMGTGIDVKNLFELKNGSRIWIDSNILENNWLANQVGYAILAQNADTTWAGITDLTITNNIIRHSRNAINLCGRCHTESDQAISWTQRIFISNNLLDDINGATWAAGTGQGGGGDAFQLDFVTNLVIDHNTILNISSTGDSGHIISLYDGASTGVTFTNNIVNHDGYGIFGSGFGSGLPAITQFLPGSTITGNLMTGTPSYLTYPAGNRFPATMSAVGFTSYNNGNGGNYLLAASSPYRNTATDGKDPGADINALNTALSTVLQGDGSTQTTSTSVTISSPTSASTYSTASSTVTLGGTATDSTGVTQVSWATNHGTSGIATGTTSWSASGIALQSGSNQITVTAHGATGGTASAVLTVTYTAPTISCDLNHDGSVNVLDVQLASNQALGNASCTSADLNSDGLCTIVDVQRVINSSLGASCHLGP